MGQAIDGHLALGHRFEQRRLRLRHRTVDLVDQHNVREDRARAKLERSRLLIVDREPRHIGRLQIGRALDPGDGRALDRLSDRTRKDRLRRARNVFEENVSLCGERREHERDLLMLTEHHTLDVRQQALRAGRQAFAQHFGQTVARAHRPSKRCE
jgi:hypothetical protein